MELGRKHRGVMKIAKGRLLPNLAKFAQPHVNDVSYGAGPWLGKLMEFLELSGA